ncbi:unnamed protein product, partial [Ectocarpus sp. 8 AP-2014]
HGHNICHAPRCHPLLLVRSRAIHRSVPPSDGNGIPSLLLFALSSLSNLLRGQETKTRFVSQCKQVKQALDQPPVVLRSFLFALSTSGTPINTSARYANNVTNMPPRTHVNYT